MLILFLLTSHLKIPFKIESSFDTRYENTERV